MAQRFLLSSLVLLLFSPLTQAANVTLSSLLDEMLDRNAVTQFPDPAYTCKQASSYDRASVSPDDKKTWFANFDTSQFVREEMNGDRKEWVLMDEKGPGAIVRWWITSFHYKVNFRIYIDGKTEPEITANVGDLIGGNFLVDAPLSSPRANGRNLYLPIPYAKSIKVTVDDMPTQQNLYYQINFRTYGDGVNVESFTMQNLRSIQPQIEKAQKALLEKPIKKNEGRKFKLAKNGGGTTVSQRTRTPASVNSFAVKIDAEDIPQAMRSVLLKISFDGIQTVRVPLGDFFGGGVGINPYQVWYMKIEEDGTLRSFWRMPFKKKYEITFVNYSDQDVTITFKDVDTQPIRWTDRTMYFFADWRQDRAIETFHGEENKQDWNYIALQGKGIFVGDSLSIVNPALVWWGEGDEKIYVDGETFPSHFGTGTEDYYGYAWGTPDFFDAPSHAQPRAEGPGSFGNVTNDRFRILDGIPFTKDFRFDMEVWHWAATNIDYAVVTYWYGFPGLKPVDVPTGKYPSDERLIEEARAKVAYKLVYVFEMADFKIKELPPGHLSRQEMGFWKDGTWKDDDQLFWTGTKPGDKLELLVQIEKSGPQKLICEMTKANDYGQFQFYLDGKKVGDVVDLFNNNVISTGPVEIGTVDVEQGEHVLTIEVVGKNADSLGTLFGLDVYRFE
ncbi:MAG: DUF2961 domain-containing protein [Planctomycetaceae bacterium]|nr:DUF2961 domain-containing protein [Planctomycetaceae bacterium]